VIFLIGSFLRPVSARVRWSIGYPSASPAAHSLPSGWCTGRAVPAIGVSTVTDRL